MPTVEELRRDIKQHVVDAGTGRNPLTKAVVQEAYKEVASERIDPGTGIAKSRYKLLEACGAEPSDPFRAGNPFTKHQLKKIQTALENGTESDWGPVGRVERILENNREYKVPAEPSVRYAVLVELARHGPGTAIEISDASDVDWSSVESEMPRLYKQMLAGRSKRPGFDDVYTYWITPRASGLLAKRGDEPEDGLDEHYDLHKRYSKLPRRSGQSGDA